MIGHTSGVHVESETADEISLGRRYEYGDGVPQDYATALYWYQMAATARDEAAEAGVQRIEHLLKVRHLLPARRA